ncbi:porin family protein [Winogradskyella ursingii]|uniref:outer membrane beta-barrel protein n=1 Tax=Winogradskyella ursingii TaxID=2686079 RepID=UPI0015CE4ED5|nr:outer membrane beta-barrel protein [Winogradskyella ursingii]
MRYSILALFLFAVSFSGNSQTQFGVKGGVSVTFFKIDEGNFGDNPDTEVGYFGGFFVDFKIDKSFHIQPELVYKGIGELNFINAPIYLKYDVNNNFHFLVGPSLNYFFDIFNNKFKVRADVSLAYDLSNNLDIHMKYTLGFEELSPNIVFLGLGYRL